LRTILRNVILIRFFGWPFFHLRGSPDEYRGV
jgi:hypothetical protein